MELFCQIFLRKFTEVRYSMHPPIVTKHRPGAQHHFNREILHFGFGGFETLGASNPFQINSEANSASQVFSGYRSILSPTRCDRIKPESVDLQEVDGQKDACPPVTLFIDLVRVSIGFLLSYIFFTSQKNDHHLIFLVSKKQNETDTKQADRQNQKKQAGHPSPCNPPEKRKEYQYIRFSKRWYSPFPPGSQCCLFSSLAASLSLGLRLIFSQTIFDEAKYVGVWLSVCIPIPSSSRGKNIFPQIRTHADERTAIDSGSSQLPVRETLLSGCFKTRASRW